MYPLVKRFFDLLLAAFLLLLLSPVLVPIVIGLLLTGEREVLYLQDRVGYKNRIFKIWKFATMLKNSPNMGTGDMTTRNDPRVTPMGRFLRMSKINELPQLVNILKGDMSFVGPRPLMKVGFDRYSPDMQARVYQVVPGLTGIGSIIFRDEELIITRSALSPAECYAREILPHKGAVEVWYQQHYRFYTDVMILFLTAWTIIRPASDLVYRVFPDLPRFQPHNVTSTSGFIG